MSLLVDFESFVSISKIALLSFAIPSRDEYEPAVSILKCVDMKSSDFLSTTRNNRDYRRHDNELKKKKCFPRR